MSAIAIESVTRILHSRGGPEAVLHLARARGWRIISIPTTRGEVQAIDLDSVEPGIRVSIEESALDRGEHIYLSTETIERGIARAREKAAGVRCQVSGVREKVVSIARGKVPGVRCQVSGEEGGAR